MIDAGRQSESDNSAPPATKRARQRELGAKDRSGLAHSRSHVFLSSHAELELPDFRDREGKGITTWSQDERRVVDTLRKYLSDLKWSRIGRRAHRDPIAFHARRKLLLQVPMPDILLATGDIVNVGLFILEWERFELDCGKVLVN
ncbi:hypothetical protein PG991_006668 [Apiospora marii]|uniref:Uncharacterized protein n=1 Tax=Apiospora marii TaxID=335849 RepID=A0ABR1RZS3_9PEZI